MKVGIVHLKSLPHPDNAVGTYMSWYDKDCLSDVTHMHVCMTTEASYSLWDIFSKDVLHVSSGYETPPYKYLVFILS